MNKYPWIIYVPSRRKHFETTSMYEKGKWEKITEKEFNQEIIKNRKFYKVYYEEKYQIFEHIAAKNIKYRRW